MLFPVCGSVVETVYLKVFCIGEALHRRHTLDCGVPGTPSRRGLCLHCYCWASLTLLVTSILVVAVRGRVVSGPE